MEYRIRIFFHAETSMILPVEELYAIENDYQGRLYVEKLQEEMKWQLFHGINKEIINPPEFIKKMCVLVEPLPSYVSEKDIEKIARKLMLAYKDQKIFIHTKKGIEEISIR